MKLDKFSETLQQVITPKVLGIFWVSSRDLNERPYPFEEIDYYLDGLLTKHYRDSKNIDSTKIENDKKCFFVSNSFAHPFFVVYLNSNKEIHKNEIAELDNVLNKLKTESSNSIVILQNDNNKITELIKKNFSDYELTTLIIE